MKQAFLSYARDDLRRAKRLYAELSLHPSLRIWFDKFELLPGMKWEPAIRKAIRESDYFLALLSQKAVSNRGFRHTELREALAVAKEFPAGSIFLIPVRLDECPMPHAEMEEYHQADMFPKWAEGIDLLCRSLGVAPVRTSPASGAAQSRSSRAKRSPKKIGIQKMKDTGHVRYDISLVALDKGVPTIDRITRGLNGVQSHFYFTVQRMQTPARAVKKIGDYPQLSLPHLPASFYARLGLIETDYVICLSKRLLAVKEGKFVYYNYLADQSAFDPRVFFISYSALGDYAEEAGVSMDSAIAYLIVGELVDFFLKLDYHKENRNCPMDFVDDHSKLTGGLKAGKFCRFCSRTLAKNRDFAVAFRSMLAWDR